MGIKGINKFLETKCYDAFFSLPLKSFSECRIAIDACGYFHRILCATNKDLILKCADPLEEIDKNLILGKARERLIIFLTQLCNLQITPVFVWDGLKIQSKGNCVKKRIEVKDKIKNELNKLREELEEENILLRDKKTIKRYKELLTQYNNNTKEDLDFFKDYLTSIGFPNLTAKNEGEKLCAHLATIGYVSAVWSVDTDNYALGTPILITEISNYDELGDMLVKVVDLRIILKKLGKSHSWLVDLCIMCGCDFNTNIPNIGPAKSAKFLDKFETIENISNFNAKGKDEDGNKIELTDDDCFNILNYEECRDIFKFKNDDFDGNISNLNFNIDNFIKNYNLIESEVKLIDAINKIMNIVPKNSKYSIKKK